MAANLKTALVTGAGSGIGRSIATTLAEMGLRVALVGRDREKLERTRADFVKGRDSAFVAPCDITDRAAVKVARRPDRGGLGIDRRPGLQRRHQCEEPQPGVARPRRLGSNDRHQSHGLVQPGSPCAAVDAPAEEWPGDPDLLGVGHCVPARWEAPATRRRSSASRPWASAWDVRKALTAFARR